MEKAFLFNNSKSNLFHEIHDGANFKMGQEKYKEAIFFESFLNFFMLS